MSFYLTNKERVQLAGLCREFADVIEKDPAAADAIAGYDLEEIIRGAIDISDATCSPGAEEFEKKAAGFLERLDADGNRSA